MKCVSITTLGLAVLGFPAASFQVLLKIVVCVTALLVITQAVRSNKQIWAVVFGLIAVMFNPVLPVALSPSTLLWVDAICLIAFLVSPSVPERQREPYVKGTKSETGKLVNIDVWLRAVRVVVRLCQLAVPIPVTMRKEAPTSAQTL
jgi:hypothetical protein